MSQSHYEETLSRIHRLQEQLEGELEGLISKKREEFKYKLEKGKVIFDEEIRELHEHHRIKVWSYLRQSKISYVLTSPIIYGVFFPLVLLDLAVFIYQQVCFRAYGIPLVLREDYIVVDRQHLRYLNGIEKINCMYCGYGNGVIEYIREVFARTEQFWCPIKNAKRRLRTHHYVEKFVDYGDVVAYKKKLTVLREEINCMQKEESIKNKL